MFEITNKPVRALDDRKRILGRDAVTKFDRMLARVRGKLQTAVAIDHCDTTPAFMKNRRADELSLLIESARKVRCMSDLSLVDLMVDDFAIDGK